jgi:hypothetical protein
MFRHKVTKFRKSKAVSVILKIVVVSVDVQYLLAQWLIGFQKINWKKNWTVQLDMTIRGALDFENYAYSLENLWEYKDWEMK